MSSNEKLLTAEEQDACQKIAASGDGLEGQRAAALLAIDQGATRTQVSEQTSLTSGQIGYLLRAFGRKRLELFHNAEASEEQPAAEPAEPEMKKGKGKKAKKSKKDKKAKAEKKDKKPKKDKKDKAKKDRKDKASKKKSKKGKS